MWKMGLFYDQPHSHHTIQEILITDHGKQLVHTAGLPEDSEEPRLCKVFQIASNSRVTLTHLGKVKKRMSKHSLRIKTTLNG